MAGRPDWQWNEMKQIGSDFADADEVCRWEQFQESLGDPIARAQAVLDRVGIGAGGAIIDFGSGPGYIVMEAARRGADAWAVDISEAMLERSADRARQAGLADRITFAHAGFLTYEHAGRPVDAVVTQAAMHHLPDVWKGVALARIADMLRSGGKLYLQDVVFSFGVRRCVEAMAEMDAEFRRAVPGEFGHRLAGHLGKEYSTFDWVLEGLLRSAGFEIESKETQGVMTTYVCERR